jgi:AmmeMemoRadiSam system protein B
MSDPLLYPKLRWPIDLRIETIGDQEILLVSCPLGISPQPLGLVAAVAPIVAEFEGRLSLEEITTKFSQFGLQQRLIEELVQMLDQGLFLESPRFFEAERRIRGDFAQSPLRPAALAGLSYSNDAQRLTQEIDAWLGHGSTPLAQPSRTMLGLVSPHIDYRRGGICYGKTYAYLRPERHDLYILIGTAHQYSRHLFHLTSKDFASPLGTIPCDHDFVERLAALYGTERSFADEILHRREHSLELQAPFLRRVTTHGHIVPILVGGFHQMVSAQRAPHEFETYESFVGALVECLRERIAQGQRICFLSGVDMAHVGRHFGDSRSLTPALMEDVAERDHQYLECIKNQDRRALFEHIAFDGDARRICGFPTMYTVIDCLDRLGLSYETDLIDYRQAVDYTTDCAVTFAGVGMYTSPVMPVPALI